eukprot:8108251-Karenia_brevis.AAC.1
MVVIIVITARSGRQASPTARTHHHHHHHQRNFGSWDCGWLEGWTSKMYSDDFEDVYRRTSKM